MIADNQPMQGARGIISYGDDLLSQAYAGPLLNINTLFPRYGDSMLKMRRSLRPFYL